MMTPQMEHSYFSLIVPTEMDICELHEKVFKIILLRKNSEIQEDTNRQVNGSMKTMQEQNNKCKFNKAIDH